MEGKSKLNWRGYCMPAIQGRYMPAGIVGRQQQLPQRVFKQEKLFPSGGARRRPWPACWRSPCCALLARTCAGAPPTPAWTGAGPGGSAQRGSSRWRAGGTSGRATWSRWAGGRGRPRTWCCCPRGGVFAHTLNSPAKATKFALFFPVSRCPSATSTLRPWTGKRISS